MKKIIITLLFINLHIILIAQINATFNYEESNCPAWGSDYQGCHFDSGTDCVNDGWFGNPGTPFLFQEPDNNKNSSVFVGLMAEKGYENYLYTEGIYINYNFIKDKHYILSYQIRTLDFYNNQFHLPLTVDKFYFHITDGLTPVNDEWWETSLVPNISNMHIQTIETLNNYKYSNWTTLTFEFQANDNYSQLWLYPVDDDYDIRWVQIDNIFLSGSCCENIILYQNNNNLPEVSNADNTIKAGRNIDNNQPVGNVIVGSNDNVVFSAGQDIILEPGFDVVEGGEFIAKIENCISPLEAEITSYIYQCNTVLVAATCGGSGDYTYEWNHVSDNSISVLVSPTELTEYRVTVIDNILGFTANANIEIIQPDIFNGDFTYEFIPNIFTPNGDGINDIWYLPDNEKVEYAYNAWKYDFYIFNRWGNELYNDTKQTNHSGFYEGIFSWDGIYNGSYVSDGDYYFVLLLYNCSHPEGVVLSGLIHVSTSSKDENKKTFLQQSKINIFPNPNNGIFKIFYNNDKEPYNIKITTNTGEIIYSKKSKNNIEQINLERYYEGLYILIIETKFETIHKKIIIKK